MKKKIILLYVLLGVLIVTGLGLFIWHQYSKNNLSPITIPLIQPTNKVEIPQVSEYQVPILMYHYIRNAEGESELGQNLSVSPQNFEAHVKYLKENNYETLKLVDLSDPDKKAISKIIYEKKKPIVLTFDDGYTDAYSQAWPILKKYDFVATFFIIRNYVGKDNYMTQAQIDELAKAGMEIGSHSLTHPDLTKISPDDAQSQIALSKENTLTFCYPSGKYNQAIVKLIQEAGYQAAVTTKFGIADQNSSILELPRVRVENTSAETLMDKIDAASK